ncbi:MAG TPA: LytTR family DNA-binding domain-containing protein [Kofleriaceae bacterium]|nr:LytTR family DNA-binding domain-containing protein [Kofleriaceae bacterium]
MKPRVFVVDDEELAVRRLVRLLEATERVEVAGTATDPRDAITRITDEIAAVFLDISMPEVDGFAVARRLPPGTLIVFTTAHDQHALRAFAVNALDYLVKPVRAEDLSRALDKLARRRGGPRLTSRIGDRTHVIELDRVTHFQAEDKLTYALTLDHSYVVDGSITALEERHAGDGFFRIHRATLVRLTAIAELLANPPRVRLRDCDRVLQVARDRVRALKDVLG